jgi:hypothetical protein
MARTAIAGLESGPGRRVASVKWSRLMTRRVHNITVVEGAVGQSWIGVYGVLSVREIHSVVPMLRDDGSCSFLRWEIAPAARPVD